MPFKFFNSGSRVALSSLGLVSGGLGIGGIFFPPLFIAAAAVGGAACFGSVGRWYGCRKKESTLKDHKEQKEVDAIKEWEDLNAISLEDLAAVPELKKILELFHMEMLSLFQKTIKQRQESPEGGQTGEGEKSYCIS